MALNRSEQIVAEKTMCILLLRGENSDKEKIWAYVGVRADKLEEFMKAQESDVFFPDEYGVVIESGTGEPDDETKEKMTKEYGFNHDAMIDIPDTQKAGKVTGDLVTAAKPKPE